MRTAGNPDERSEIRDITSSLLLFGRQSADHPAIAETCQDGVAVVVGTFLAGVGGKHAQSDMVVVDPSLKAPFAKLATLAEMLQLQRKRTVRSGSNGKIMRPAMAIIIIYDNKP